MTHSQTSAERSARTNETVAVLGAGGTMGFAMARQAGAGTRLKLVTNSWVLAVVEAGAETIALAEGLGLDPSLFFRAIEGGALDLPYLRMKGEAASGLPSIRGRRRSTCSASGSG